MIKNLKPFQTYNKKAYLINTKDLDQDRDYCLICLQLVVSPQECLTCKSTFCHSCSQNWKKIHNQCPMKCSKSWNLRARPQKRYYLRCPYSEKCMFAVLWENWDNHLVTCEFIPQHIKQAIENRNSYKCQNGHTLLTESQTRKCSDCQQRSCCLSTCDKCSLHYCKKCRQPKFHRAVCPNQHKYAKIGSASFDCDNCFRSFTEKPCFQDRECELSFCQVCMANLPSYENEQELMKMFNMLRKYSAGKISL